jgi:predicted DCC family thiol-disulfide oxidoreductase YuxK
MESTLIVLYDGYCNLCSGTVQFILKRDKKKRFRFASIQGKYAQKLLEQQPLPLRIRNSFVLMDNGHIRSRSGGALHVLRHLGGIWPLAFLFILIPPFIRDAVYEWIARNRYRWFGKKKVCWIPEPAWKDVFLD